MGSCLSCCRCREERDEERRPLLQHEDSLPPPQSPVEQLADIAAALSAGKLPSQEQLNKALQKLLNSDLLRYDDKSGTYGPLSESGKSMLIDLREVIGAALQVGIEKNSDDKLQDLVFQSSLIDQHKPPVDVEIKVDTKKVEDKSFEALETLTRDLPTEEELKRDLALVRRSLFMLSQLLLSSAMFRIILSDLLLVSGEMVADVAANVASVAAEIQASATRVEDVVRPFPTRGDVIYAEGDYPPRRSREEPQNGDVRGQKAPEISKELLLERVEDVVSRVQQSPAYTASLRTLLAVLQKYYHKFSATTIAVSELSAPSTSDVVPPTKLEVSADPHLSQALDDLKTLLERLAPGQKLDEPIDHLSSAVKHVTDSAPDDQSGLRRFFSDLGAWFDKALGPNGVTWAQSRSGRNAASQLYDRGIAHLNTEANRKWKEDLQCLFASIQSFIEAIGRDKSTTRLIRAIERFEASFATFTGRAIFYSAGVARGEVARISEEVHKDVYGWLLPRVLTALRSVPLLIPRVEVKHEKLDLVVDGLVIGVPDVVPDEIRFSNWSEVVMELGEEGVQSFTRTRLHIDGLRISIQDIGYYLQLKGPAFLGWEDNGFLSVWMGDAAKEGLTVDVEIETGGKNASLGYKVTDVKVDAPGVKFSIDNSHHWIINSLIVQPLLGPIVRRLIGSVLAGAIRNGLESVSERAASIQEGAEKKSGSERMDSLTAYCDAILQVLGGAGRQPTDEEDDKLPDLVPDPEPIVETETTATVKGVIRTTRTTEPFAENNGAPDPSLQIAIGVGEQILPGKGPPETGVERAAKTGREALDQVEESVEQTAETAEQVRQEITDAGEIAKEQYEHAADRAAERRNREIKHGGWRSDVFG